MDRRTVLLGSGAAFATVLAGCAEDTDQEDGTNNDTNDDANGDPADEKNGKKDEKKDGKADVPGFDRDDFRIDSDVLSVTEITYDKRTLDVRVMILTDDRDELIDELRALAPGLARSIRDAEAFLAAVDEIEFTLVDEDTNRMFSFYLDAAWLRAFLEGDITDDELIDRVRDSMERQ
ncbi:hypothetical protein RBH26_20355 [Natronolimnohabitans sp. A-GB9]|uniref:hypothetical protein n=1 Tax=Natronolimnohabitans sp. A-GB9 TaxID=3069757 RepID=UPI0027B7AE50|nr:hypothetical protein [Natronolimnohabitans sp. A-GB9]MDQ2052796.1 hypothetical protein [Natronolimnohabitans sp. A-GB9]